MIRLRVVFQLNLAWPPKLELPKLAKASAKRLQSGEYPIVVDTTGEPQSQRAVCKVAS